MKYIQHVSRLVEYFISEKEPEIINPIPAHELRGEDGRKGMIAMLDLAAIHLCMFERIANRQWPKQRGLLKAANLITQKQLELFQNFLYRDKSRETENK